MAKDFFGEEEVNNDMVLDDDNLFVLNDEDGNEIKFEFLDLIELENENYVVFEYKIKNNADNQFSVGLSYRDNSTDSAGNVVDESKADKNVIVGYHAQTTSLDANADYSFNTVYDATNTGNEWATGWAALGNTEVDCGDCYANGISDNDETADVTESDTLYVYVIVMVDSLSQAASFSGNLNFSLIAA